MYCKSKPLLVCLWSVYCVFTQIIMVDQIHFEISHCKAETHIY